MSESTRLETVKIVMLKGEKGDQGAGVYDDTEVRELITEERQARAGVDNTLQIDKANKNALLGNIFISNLVLDGTTDNTQTIVDALDDVPSGIFVIPYNCKCNRDTIMSSLDSNIVVIDPYYQVIQGEYVAKYFKLLTAKNEPNNDSVVIVEDFHHPCFTINNEETEDSSVDRHATLGFANGYNANGFLKFSFMISQALANGHYRLLFRRMSKYDGTILDKSTIVLDELGTIGFNEATGDFDYAFGATDRTVNKDATLVNIANNGGRAGLAFTNGDNTRRLDIFTDPSLKGMISYGNGQQIVFPDENSIKLDTFEKITWRTISGATPTATKGRYFTVNNASAVTMTNFTCDSDIVTFMFPNANTTLKWARFRLKGGVDWKPTANSSITFVKNVGITNDWIELSRNEM